MEQAFNSTKDYVASEELLASVNVAIALKKPLLWMAPSQVSAENAAAIGEVMQMYRQHRQAWKNALISPVGSRPNGAAISGFYADSGYLLVFREADAPAQSQLDLPEYKQAELIYSTAPVELDDQGKVTFAEPRSAALYKLTL